MNLLLCGHVTVWAPLQYYWHLNGKINEVKMLLKITFATLVLPVNDSNGTGTLEKLV